MVILITGASHVGKTVLAQKLLEEHHYPYLSIDHLKMGLIRSGNTDLTPMSDDTALTAYLWPIVREIIKTAIENRQNLIVEGCYVPRDWAADFEPPYRAEIEFHCLVMSEQYIRSHWQDVLLHANDIERRLCDGVDMESVIADNAYYRRLCDENGYSYILIDEEYPDIAKSR